MADQYTVAFVKVLSFLRDLEGSMAYVGHAFSATEVVEKMALKGLSVTQRHVRFALEEASQTGLAEVGNVRIDDPREDFYMSLDITGPGLRLLEGLEVRAAAEGKKDPWLWSMVEKAGTLANLVSLVIQIAKGG